MKEYLIEWEKAGSPKPSNDKEFIKDFIAFLESKDKDHFEFDGENHYCGYTATVYEIEPSYCLGKTLAFEFAYGIDFVKVFTAAHNGFWVPEYIDLKGDDATPILAILNKRFIQWGGFAL
jgi:hypothetical protein